MDPVRYGTRPVHSLIRIQAILVRVPRGVWWALLAIWAVGIFVSSSISHLVFVGDPMLDYLVRKTGHFLVFAILAALAWLALSSSRVRHAWRWALLAAALYAVTDEFHQNFTAGRVPFVGDILVDVVGVAVGLWVVSRLVGESRVVRESASAEGSSPAPE
jgi:VanZ family protein